MTYLLRDIDPDFWRRVKVKAAKEGVPIRSLLLSLLLAWLGGKI